MYKKRLTKDLLFNILALIFTVVGVIYIPNEIKYMPTIGIMLLLVTFILLIRYKDENRLNIFICIITIVNVCMVFSNCFNRELHVVSWQYNIYRLIENVFNIKNALLFNFSLLLGLTITYKPPSNNKVIAKYNFIIIAGGFIFLIFALFTGYSRNVSRLFYTSNAKPIYEYAIVVFIFVWLYSGVNTKVKKLLVLYTIIYMIQSLYYGDRSAAFPMLIMLTLLLFNKTKTYFVLPLGVLAIIFANIINVFRTTGFQFNIALIDKIIKTGLYSDTISFSFYAGTTINMYASMIQENWTYFLKFIFSVFLGQSIISSDLSSSAVKYSNILINKGGGFSYNYYYFWFGFLGVLVFGFMIGCIVGYIFSKNSKLTFILQNIIVVFSMRWYVYYPIAFFRTSLIIPIFLFFICEILSKYKLVIANKKYLLMHKYQKNNDGI